MPATQTPISRDPTLEAHVLWVKHQREILIALGVILIALLGYAGFWLYSARREATAAAELANARDASSYQQVISQYDTTKAGATAYLLLAEAQRKEGKYADANATLQRFVDKHPKHEMIASARLAMAANLQSLGKIDEALAQYQRVAADYPKSYAAPMALISQVQILKTKGQTDAARRACETILSEHRDSIWANEASQQLRELKPPTPPGAAPGMPGGPSLSGQAPGSAPPPLLARPPAAPAPAGAPSGGAAPSPAGPGPKTSPNKP
jgi:tetratricopeptide (TPR) repeat protein